MQTQMTVQDLMGSAVTDSNGTKVGTVKQVYLNDASGAPEWVTVHTGWFGMRESFLPLSGSSKTGETLQVPYGKDTIKEAPNVDADEHLSHDQIVDLYRHYGIRPPSGRTADSGEGGKGETPRDTTRGDTGQAGTSEEGAAGMATGSETMSGRSGTGAESGRAAMGGRPDRAATGSAREMGPAGTSGKPVPGKASTASGTRGQETRDRAMPEGVDRDAAATEVTRSEEQLRIGTEQHETGRAHIRKWVETEAVERTVPIAHQELKIEREPITGDTALGEVTISEDDMEIILYEERPVIAKETVAVERIRVSTERVEEQQTVRDQVRKEHVEVTRDEAKETTGRPDTGRR